ncbi:hypothetical protein HZA97_01890 [Candidatus Woesearchaeota archaeon]|nr:hypothetical protein [Candidatus Woesearchaeota archaeon]
MNLGKLIRTLVLPAAFLIGMAGCTDYSDKKYSFKGKIDGETVEFREINVTGTVFWDGTGNILSVERTDGVQVTYQDIDGSNNFQIDHLRIVSSEGELNYDNQTDTVVWPALYSEAQPQFEAYLQKILDHKKEAGLQKLREKSIFGEGAK